MSNGRGGSKKRAGSGREPGAFVAIPWTVLDSAAYLGLSMHARALLLEVARQYRGDDNGRMLLSRAYLATRGWNSSDMITKAKAELLRAELIFETVKGQRPSKASWYAVTWLNLDRLDGFDLGTANAFERGAYRKSGLLKNAVLVPSHGTGRASTAPPHGTETPSPVPPHGAVEPVFGGRSVPPHGHPLDMPSAGVGVRGAVSSADANELSGRPVLALVKGANR